MAATFDRSRAGTAALSRELGQDEGDTSIASAMEAGYSAAAERLAAKCPHCVAADEYLKFVRK